MHRHVTSAEFDGLLRQNLGDHDFKRILYALERGPGALRLLDLRTQRDVTAKQYRDALTGCAARLRNGSIQPYQVATLIWAFRRWRAAVSALAEIETPGWRVTLAAE